MASPSLCLADSAGKPQQLTSPDQVPEGLAKSDWSSIRAAYEAGRHAFMPVVDGWQARNPGQQWTTKFDGRGFVSSPRDGGWQWGLELKRYGFAGADREVGGVPAVQAAGSRLTYTWDTALTEWFLNDQRGLEHGYTVKERPAPALNSPPSTLNFTLALRGSLVPRVTADGKGVEFCDATGAPVVNYSGLKVWDADGKILPSHFAPLDPRQPALVTLAVDESAARYPLTIDPIAQQAYLKASNTGAEDWFGYSVSVSGDTVVVGAYYEASSTTGVNSTPNESAFGAGAAYVFVRNGTTWSQQAYLKASNTGAGDWFGVSVSVFGDTVVVGAYYEDSSTTGVNSTPNNNANESGAAYVFVRSGTNWSQQAYLKASDTGSFDYFGSSVSVSGDTVVVGAFGEYSSTTGVNSTPNDNAPGAGAAYVFVRSGTNWSQEAYLKTSSTGASDYFGNSVSVSGDTVVVGAIYEDSSTTGVNSTPNDLGGISFDSGAAYVFVRSGTNWSQQAYLKASNTGAIDYFGSSVSVSGDTVVVGAYYEDSSTTGVNSTPNDLGGISFDSGAAYVFVRSGTNWSQQAYLKASNTGEYDQFGYSVSVSGDTVVVGARYEDSSTTGVNSTPNDLGGISFDSGAAYVFVRSGTNWSQEAYLKTSSTGASDYFGNSVSVSGDTVVVGAFGEDSSTTGVNSTPNESAGNAGAVYVFTIGLGPVVFVDGVYVGGSKVDRVDSASITMANTGSGAAIYFTLDGSTPDFTDIPYTGPFALTNSATIRAIAYNFAFTDSAEAAPITVQVWPTYPLSATTPGGGSIGLSPAPYSAGYRYVSNTVVTLTATPANNWSFLGWTGDSSATSNVTSVLMDQARTVTGVFGTALNLFTNGSGQVQLNPPVGPYAFGTTVKLTALPAPGYYFFGWANAASGFANPLTFTVTNAAGLTANFGALAGNQVSLVVLPNGNGTVSVSPAKNVYTNGEPVTLTAWPAANQTFTGWSGDAAGNLNPLVLALTNSTLITANFAPGSPTNPPVITQPPLNRTLSAGANTLLSFSLTGDGPFAYQWRLNQSPISGATNPTLALNGIMAAQAGVYNVVVTGPGGAVTSAPASVAILGMQLIPSGGWPLPLLILDGAVGTQYRLETSPNLSFSNWSLLSPLTLPTARFYYADTASSNQPARFYRAVPQ